MLQNVTLGNVEWNTTSNLTFSDGVINQHPKFHLYICIYALTVIFVVITMCVRGVLYMKVGLEFSGKSVLGQL